MAVPAVPAVVAVPGVVAVPVVGVPAVLAVPTVSAVLAVPTVPAVLAVPAASATNSGAALMVLEPLTSACLRPRNAPRSVVTKQEYAFTSLGLLS